MDKIDKKVRLFRYTLWMSVAFALWSVAAYAAPWSPGDTNHASCRHAASADSTGAIQKDPIAGVADDCCGTAVFTAGSDPIQASEVSKLASGPKGRGYREGTLLTLGEVLARASTPPSDTNNHASCKTVTTLRHTAFLGSTGAANVDAVAAATGCTNISSDYAVVFTAHVNMAQARDEAQTKDGSYTASALVLVSKGRGCKEGSCITWTDQDYSMTSNRFLAFDSWLPFPFSTT